MFKIGIRAHDIGKMSAKELSETVHALGFDGIQLVFKKALLDEVDFNHLSELKESLRHTKIMMLGAYFNPVHPDYKELIQGVEYFEKHLKIAKELHADYVGSETGSLMGSPWGYVKENHDDLRLKHVIDIFRKLVSTAEKHDSYVAIEGAYAHVCYSPFRIKQVIEAIHSKHLKVTIDLFNFLSIENYQKRMEIFEESLKLLKNDIVIYHLKDFIIEDGKLIQVGLGKGLMDYPKIIKRIEEVTPNAYLIFEGVTGADIPESLKLIKDLIERK